MPPAPQDALELDVRGLPPPKRHPEIFRTLDALKPGEAFVLVNDHDPKPVLFQLQLERPGRFEWNVLESGGERFRVELRRRAVDGTRNVTEYLEEDHRRLDALLGVVERLAGEAAFARAGARFAEFACGLGRHIVAEEEVLFPVFERLTGVANGPTVVMRHEHTEIRRWMDQIAAAVEAKDAAATRAAIEGLREVLSGHNMKEEQMLYPMTDRAAGGARERDELVKRLQAV